MEQVSYVVVFLCDTPVQSDMLLKTHVTQLP